LGVGKVVDGFIFETGTEARIGFRFVNGVEAVF